VKFNEFNLSADLLAEIEKAGFVEASPIQEQTIPLALEGKDVIGQAQTGTGKTAAFGLPTLEKIRTEEATIQALVIAPTRELAVQSQEELFRFGRSKGVKVRSVYGGSSIEKQIKALKSGAHIVVGTPGRLLDLIKRKALKLQDIETLILDEADEMLNMGFTESIDEILSAIPSEHQTLLFSATMGPDIERIAKNYLRQYREIVVGSRNEGAEHVNHIYYAVRAQDKYAALKRIVDYYPRIYAIIFCRTRLETQEVADHLIRDGYSAEALHGDLAQAQRDLTMQKFRTHRTQLLVATDVAARGLDVNELTHVINYGLPDDVENYTHRSGRTGRAGKRGTSISIIHLREKGKVRVIERVIGKKFEVGTLPEPKEICTKQLYKVIDNLEHTEPDEEQIAPFLPEVMHKLEWLTKEELVKRLVQQEFGRFLTYYADAPEIVQPTAREEREEKGNKRDRRDDKRARNAKGNPVAEEGYTRLFLNFGKRDNFFAREIINLVNRYVKGKVEIGRIDLLNNCSFFEVPEEQAELVMGKMAKAKVGERRVVVDFADRADGKADSGAHGPKGRTRRNEDRYADSRKKSKPKARKNAERREQNDKEQRFGKDDWKQFFD